MCPTIRTEPENPFKRVLVVEDDQQQQTSLRELCKRIDRKIRVDCVESGDAAETLLRHGKLYDLVVVDVMLANNISGIELWRSCRRAYTQLKFLFISGISPAEFDERIGLVDPKPAFLQKPFSILECTEALRRSLVHRG